MRQRGESVAVGPLLGLADPGLEAPEWKVSRWFGVAAGPTLAELRGRVIVMEAFQMLCPGCVSHGLPQAARIHATFSAAGVTVVGLHSVFEHHAVMGPDALEVFLGEYRVAFPVAVDMPGNPGPIPLTMRAYELDGTPTLLLIDRQGHLRARHFGAISDLVIGAQIAHLLHEDHE